MGNTETNNTLEKATKTATAWVAAKGSKKLNIDKGEPLPSTVGVKRK